MGRPKSDEKLVPVMVRLAAAEVERIDAERGDRSRSDYVRSALHPLAGGGSGPLPAAPPADPSSGGAGLQPSPRPTGETTAPRPAPPDLPERPPSDRQLAARVFAAMREIDPTDAGPVTTPEEATFLRQWSQRTLDAWKAKHAPPAPAEKPQRRQGTITRPADRAPKPPVTVNGREIYGRTKRHADDCRCLSCMPPKAAAR